jgi:hypothetical protein
MGPRGRRARRRGLMVGAAIGASAARRNSTDDNQVQDQPAAGQEDDMAQLEKLAQLKAEGILTEDEFQAKKKQILGI